MAENLNEQEKIIRKLRKKLRQIEVLEFSDRELNDEEFVKVRYSDSLILILFLNRFVFFSKKAEIRKELTSLLKTKKDIKYEDNEEDGFTVITKEHLENIEDMKRKSEDEFTPEAAVKKQCSNTTENVTDIEEENVTHEQTTTPEVQTEAFSDNNGGEAAPIVTEIVEQNVVESTVAQPHASGSQGQVDIQQPSTSSSSRTNHESKQSKKKQKKKKNGLINSLWTVTELEGHEDLVLDIDISDQDDNLAVTASRDTTVKIWNTETGHLVQSLRGHS